MIAHPFLFFNEFIGFLLTEIAGVKRTERIHHTARSKMAGA